MVELLGVSVAGGLAIATTLILRSIKRVEDRLTALEEQGREHDRVTTEVVTTVRHLAADHQAIHERMSNIESRLLDHLLETK